MNYRGNIKASIDLPTPYIQPIGGNENAKKPARAPVEVALVQLLHWMITTMPELPDTLSRPSPSILHSCIAGIVFDAQIYELVFF